MPQNRRRHDRGFTLVELMIVVSLIGVISSIAIPKYLNFTARTSRSEMQETVSKLKLYLKNNYDNQGTFLVPGLNQVGASSSSAVNPTAPVPIGQPAPWDNTAFGWNEFQFPPEGAIKMRYSYTMGAADGTGSVHDVTITVCGSFPGLGVGAIPCPGSMTGNYLYIEVFHSNGASDPPTEIPTM